MKFSIFNKIKSHAPRTNSGQSAFVAVMFFLLISLAVAGSVAFFASGELKSSRLLIKSKQSYVFAEGASEDAAYRVITLKNVPSQIVYSEGTLNATNTISAPNEFTRDITTQGAQLNIERKINVVIEKVDKTSFQFAGLVGEGGLFMQNESKIMGDVHTNGSITGQNFPEITGDASAVGTISDPPAVLGTRTEGASPQPMPIPDSVLDEWEQEAESGGVYSGSCPYKPADGTSIGPLKIPCDIEIDGSNIITLTGKLWVSGNFLIQNTAQIKVDSSYAEKSEVVIAHEPENEADSGIVRVKNSSQVLGSGTDGSYIMMVSRNNSAETGGGTEAIDVQNSSSASIYYAPHGKVLVQNSSSDVHVRTVTAWKLELKNKSIVEYEEALMEVKTPGKKWAVTSWGEKP